MDRNGRCFDRLEIEGAPIAAVATLVEVETDDVVPKLTALFPLEANGITLVELVTEEPTAVSFPPDSDKDAFEVAFTDCWGSNESVIFVGRLQRL